MESEWEKSDVVMWNLNVQLNHNVNKEKNLYFFQETAAKPVLPTVSN